MKTLRKVSLGLLLLFFTVAYSTSIPPPYYQYFVSGFLVCDTLSIKSGYSFRLFGKNNSFDSSFTPLNGTANTNDRVVALSDTTGKFHLIVSTSYKQDSIKVGLVRPGKPDAFSGIHSPNDVEYIQVTSAYFIPDEGSGCSSCGSEPRRSSATVRYEYYLPELNINFCP